MNKGNTWADANMILNNGKSAKEKTWNMKCTLGFYGDLFGIVIRMMLLASWEEDRLHQTDFMMILVGLVPDLVYLPLSLVVTISGRGARA